jgi:hypothetical protein
MPSATSLGLRAVVQIAFDPPEFARPGVHGLGPRLRQLPDPCLQFGLAGRGEQRVHQVGVEPGERLGAQVPDRKEDRPREGDQEGLAGAVHGEEAEGFAEHVRRGHRDQQRVAAVEQPGQEEHQRQARSEPAGHRVGEQPGAVAPARRVA